MSGSIALELLVILLLILANGLFSMAEIAVLSARRARLQQRANAGDEGARSALALATMPDRFLSTVQAGITLVGILTGVFSGATIAEEIGVWLDGVPGLAPYGEVIGVAAVVLVVTYFTLVLGELVPKRIALAHAEAIAGRMAPGLTWLARFGGPLVGFLSASTSAVARMFGIRGGRDESVTEEEVKHLIEQGTDAGVFEPAAQTMMERVFRFGDRLVNSLMTPRTDVIWLDSEDPPEAIRAKMAGQARSRFPVAEGDLDHVLGLVYARDLLGQILAGQAVDLRAVMRPPLYLPENLSAPNALERMREARQHIAFVVDEYGGFQGVLSVTDLMEAVVGELPPPEGPASPSVVRREDGSYLADGNLPLHAVRDLLAPADLRVKGAVQTLGGLMMAILQKVPEAGDHFELGGVRFEVVDMDKRRVDKVLIAPPRS